MREVPDRPMPTDEELDGVDRLVCPACESWVKMSYIGIGMVGMCRCGEEITRV